MQRFSYHTHTNFSDGSNALEEMLEQALKLEWEEIGISDHLIIHKNVKKSPSWQQLKTYVNGSIYRNDFAKAKEIFLRHSEEFRKIAKKYPLKVYLGYEVDYFPYDGWEEQFREFIKDLDYDYLITGNHFLLTEDYLTLVDIFRYDDLPNHDNSDTLEKCLKRHYAVIEKAVRSGLFDFLAHMDYARKIEQHKNYPLIEERLNVVKALKEMGVGCELSTKGLRKIGDFYPEDFVIKSLIDNEVSIVISDDAHNIEQLGMDFDKAEEILKVNNCKNRFKLKSCL